MRRLNLIGGSLAYRFIAWFVLIGLLPLGAYGFFSYQLNQENLRAQIMANLSALADKKSLQARVFLHERSKDALLLTQTLATQPLPLLFDTQSLERDQLKDALIALLTPQVGIGAETPFHNVLLLDNKGRVVFQYLTVLDEPEGFSKRNSALSEAFRMTQSSLTGYISDIELDVQQNSTQYITQPILYQGRLLGVAAFQMRQNRLYQIINDQIGLGKTGESVLAKHMEGNVALFLNAGTHGQQFKIDFNAAPLPVRQALLGLRGNGEVADYQGKSVLAAWRYLPELRLGLVVKIDRDEALAPLVAQRRYLWQALLLVTVTGVMLAWWLGRRQVYRVKQLLINVEKITTNDWSFKMSDHGNDEIGTLVRAFNTMAERLHHLQCEQQSLIDERTEQLQQLNSCLHQQIAESQRTQYVLQHQQDLFSEAQRLGRLGCWELDLRTNLLSWSSEVFKIFELDEAQFEPSYDNFFSLVHPDDRAKVSQVYQESLKDKKTYDIQHRLLMPDGRVKWVHERCSNHYDENGVPICSIGAVQDITIHKENDAHLRVAAVSMEMRDSIVIVSADVKILQVNQAFTRIFGYDPVDVLGRNPNILSSGRHNKTFYYQLWKSLLSSGNWYGEIWNKRKDGEVFPCRLTITVVRNEMGEISHFVATHSDITEQKRVEAEIRHLAFYDTLTELPNRRLLLDRLRMALFNAQRSRLLGAVLFLDMDKFKLLNDTQGHEYGDQMLIEVARRISCCVRETDTVARFGGDEFVVLLDGVGRQMHEAVEQAGLVAEKIRSSLAEPYLLNNYICHSSPSIGICLFKGEGDTADVLLKHADMAMYQVKYHGRNGVRFFDPVMKADLEHKVALENELREALTKQQLQLYYQLQVNDADEPVGAELLLRWNHPTLGLILPQQFISIAEESGFILEVSDWVLAQACMQLARWQTVPELQHFKLSVNISARAFYQADFVSRVKALLAQYGVSPALVILELTETIVLDGIDDVVDKMLALKAHGVSLSLDDFGTGYSSLSYIKQLPLDQLKIDRSFVSDILIDRNSQLMIKAILDLAGNFQLETIAEGVESHEQYQQLAEWGCHLFQGHLFSEPLPLDKMELLLQKRFSASV